MDKLKKIRENNNISYKDMAEKLSISKTFYWQLENNKRTITYLMAKKIANIFGMKPDDIFYDDINQN